MSLADQVVFILFEPLHPGNVGATARAMKNFGLERLILVNPPCYDPERARWMAPGCADILAKAKICSNLTEAFEGIHTVVGTTARHRKLTQPTFTPSEIAQQVLHCESNQVTAVLFGREDFGLPNHAVRRCKSLLRIATPEHASLNLSQAALLVAHSFFMEAQRVGEAAPGRTLGGSRKRTTESLYKVEPLADLAQMEPAVEQLTQLLGRVGYLRGIPAEKVRISGRQAFQEAAITTKQLGAIRGMVRRIDWALDNPGVNWAGTKRTDNNS